MIFIGWILLIVLTVFQIIPIGILFVWSLFNILYCLTIKHLSKAGIIYLIAGIFTAIALGLQLFCNYNILNVILK